MMENIEIKQDQNLTKALLGPCISIVLAALGISAAAVVLPEISSDFESATLDPSLVVSTYVLAVTALILPMGRAGDVYGKRNVLIAGLVIFILGACAASLATNLAVLVASRLVQGAGAAAMMAMPMAQVREIVPKDQTGRWMGVMGTMSAIGTASGPALAGIIASSLNWRAVFWLQIPLAVFALLLCLAYLAKVTSSEFDSKIDFKGATALTLFLASFVLFLSDIKHGLDQSTGVLIGVTVFAFISFLALEKRSNRALVPMHLLSSKGLRVSLMSNVGVSLIMMGILIVGPYYLTLGLGLTTAQMGFIMSIGPITAALSGVPAGRLTEKVGAEFATLIGLLGMITATAAMSFLPYFLELIGFIIAFMVLTPSYQIFLAGLNTSVMQDTSAKDHGVTSGLVNLSRNFGFVLGASLFGIIFWSIADLNLGLDDLAENIAYAMAGTFTFACCLVCSAMLVLFISRRLQN
jgi:MFS family permease